MSKRSGTDSRLSYTAIQRLIRESETETRESQHHPSTVRDIFRYGAVVGSTLERHSILPRGMEYARKRILQYEAQGESFPSGWVILADQLTDGRGRFQRNWHAPSGGVWMTLVLVNTWLPGQARLLSLAAGVACCEALRTIGVQAHVKWVNDVHVHGRKIAGILIESFRSPTSAEEYLLVGVGININNTEFPPELAASAISASQVLAREVPLDTFLPSLLAKFSWNIGVIHYEEARLLAENGGFDADVSDTTVHGHLLFDAWRSLSDTIGRVVLFGFDVQKAPLYRAIVLGIAPGGGILLQRLDDGLTVLEEAGELVYLD